MELFFLFCIGLFLGSFLNVLIDRLPRGETVLWGRSHCEFCKKDLSWYELIPLLSFIIQRGRCRHCHKKLSWQYPVIEFLTASILVLIFFFTCTSSWFYPGSFFGSILDVFADSLARMTKCPMDYSPILLFLYSFIIFPLFVIFFADLKYQIIPDSMVVTGICGTLIYLAPQGEALQGWMPFLLSAFGASAFFLAIWFITRGRGMGFGDVKLAFLLGLILGFPTILISVYIAFLTGAFVGVILIIGRNKKLKSRIAFGPFLIWGAIVAIFFGERIVQWWRNYL